jgi:hypothetical protein
LEQTQAISSLKHLGCRKYSFQKLNQFSQGNNVLDAPASTTNVLLRDIFFNLTDRSVCNKKAFFHLAISDLQEVFFQKLTQFSQGNNVMDVPAVNRDGVLSRDTFVSST